MARMMIEMWTVKAILTKFQMKMRNIFLESGVEAIYKVAKNLNVLCSWPRALWKAEFKRDELTISGEEILSSEALRPASLLLVTTYAEIQEQRDDLMTQCEIRCFY
jgi:hypothetical protein